jgi:glycosyltransferase involved in cell wall biosynthesis
MRILQLTPRLPHPPVDGGRIAMRELTRGLVEAGAELQILSLNPRKHRADPAAASTALGVTVRAVDIDTSQRIGPLWRALKGGAPYVVSRFESPEFADVLKATLRESQPDVVLVEGQFLLPYVADIRRHSQAAVVLRTLNVEHRIWEQLASNEKSPLKRTMLRRVASSLRRYEAASRAAVDAVVPISEDDEAQLRALGYRQPMFVAPCGLSAADYTPSPEPSRPTLGFLGSLDYRPNQEGILWFLDHVRPKLDDRRQSILVAGSAPPSWLVERLAKEGVELVSNLPDVRRFFDDVSVFIVPLQSGSGMRIKILEAMALQKPIVSTSVGASGMEFSAGEEILVADEADGFAALINRTANDAALRSRLGANGRRRVETTYDRSRIGRAVYAFLERLSTTGA